MKHTSIYRWLSFFVALCISVVCSAQETNSQLNPDALAYIEKYSRLAMSEMERTKIPASITLAQGLFESGFGKSQLSLKSNNHFGIKCKASWAGEKVYHDDDEKGECFRKYDHPDLSYIDHSDFLVQSSRYQSLFAYGETDYKSWAHGLKKAGYATNPLYAQKLIEFIEKYNLDRFTPEYWAKVKNEAPNASIDKNVLTNKENSSDKDGSVERVVETMEYINISNKEKGRIYLGDKDTLRTALRGKKPVLSTVSRVYDSLKLLERITVNKIPAIVLPKGYSLLKVAEMNNISISSIYRYNDLVFQPYDNDLLSKKMLIYLAPKKGRGSASTHTLRKGESLHDVSQLYGIKINKLLQLNRLKPGEIPRPNQVLYLQQFSPAKPSIDI